MKIKKLVKNLAHFRRVCSRDGPVFGVIGVRVVAGVAAPRVIPGSRICNCVSPNSYIELVFVN